MDHFGKAWNSGGKSRNLISLILTQIFVSFGGLSIPPLIPFFQPKLEFTYTQVGSLMTFLYFGAMVMSLPAGWFTDKLGIKKMIFLSQMLIGFFVFLFGLTMNHYLLAILFTFLMGLGYGMVNPPTTKGIMFLFGRSNRGFAMSLKQTGVPIGGAIAAALLPPIALFLSWRASFILAGTAIILIGSFCYILYYQGQEETPSSRTSGEETCPSKLKIKYQNKNLIFLSIAGAFSSFVQIAVVTYIILYLKDIKKFDLILAAFCLTLINIGGTLGRIFWGLLSDRLFKGSRKIVLGIIVSMIFFISLIFGLNIHLPWITFFLVLFILGLSAIGWNGVYHALIAELSETEWIGRATGLCMMIVFIGNLSGPLLFGKIIDVTGSYNMAWLSLCAAMVGAFIFYSLIQEEKTSIN